LIHVLDELSVPPGHLGEVRDRVRSIYEPAATAIGMTLVHTWIAPAVELLDQPTDLLLLWEVGDTAAFWSARSAGLGDRAFTGFWDGIDALLAGRKRRIMVDPRDESVLR
jgi:hypothetical protein